MGQKEGDRERERVMSNLYIRQKLNRDDEKMGGPCNKLLAVTFKLKLYLTLTVGRSLKAVVHTAFK
jgi:hypothetical protein